MQSSGELVEWKKAMMLGRDDGELMANFRRYIHVPNMYIAMNHRERGVNGDAVELVSSIMFQWEGIKG